MKKEKRLFPTTDFYCVSKAIVITIDANAALIYGYIWSLCGLRNGYCNASYATMAKELGLGEKTVERKVKKLLEFNLIKDISESKYNSPGVTRKYITNDFELRKLESNVSQSLVSDDNLTPVHESSDVKLTDSDVNLSESDVKLTDSDVNLSESDVNLSESGVNLSESGVKKSVKLNTEINKELNIELNKEINNENSNFNLSEELHKHREELNKQEEKENIFSHNTEQIKAALTKAQGQTYLAAMELGEDFFQLDDYISNNPELYDFLVSLINATEYESPF